METFSNVFQCGAREMLPESQTFHMAGHWRDTYFHNNNPIVLELGCGRGEYTVGLARRYPEKNFIGVDIKGARMWAGAKQATQEGLTNVAFLRTNIEMPVLFEENRQFSDTGTYSLDIAHGMRDRLLRGVMDVGVEIIRNGEK